MGHSEGVREGSLLNTEGHSGPALARHENQLVAIGVAASTATAVATTTKFNQRP